MYLLFFSPSVPLPDFYAVFVFSNDTVTLNFKVAREEFTRGKKKKKNLREKEGRRDDVCRQRRRRRFNARDIGSR